MTVRVKLVLVLLFGTLVFIGCGGSDGGLSDWVKPASVTVVANIEGTIGAPVVAGNLVAQSMLVAVKGTKVFVEEKPEYIGEADETGKFIISNVPAGRYHLVADLVSGVTTYRKRTDQINLTGEYATLKLNDPVQLSVAPYRLKINVSDMNTRAVLNSARLRAWGRDYFCDISGTSEVGPMPQGVWPVSVEVVGYQPLTFLAGFDSKKSGQLFIKMTPLTAVDKNRAPVVEIEQGFSTIRTNGQGTFSASGFDPDGDSITYSWTTSAGYFLQNTGGSTVFTAPPQDGTVAITLTAKDSKGAESKCVLQLAVLSGGGLPPNPNNRPPLAATDPIPANLAINLGAEVMLRWSGSDPDGDALTYDLFYAERGSELALKAESLSQTSYQLVNLKANATYFWMVICRDIYGAISQSPVTWQFSTGDQSNYSPYQPANPFPQDLSIDQLPSLQLSWTGGDPDLNDILTYTIMLGQDKTAMTVATSTRQTSYSLQNLELGKTYYWQVIAADNRGKETNGPVWQFSVYAPANRAPSDPVLLNPASGATNIAIDAQMRWESSDPDGDAMTFDVFLGKAFPLEKVGSALLAPAYLPSPYLEYSSRYYLQVVVRDARGLTNANSPVWSFETSAKTNGSPNVPTAVYPSDAGTGVSLKPVFTWNGGDPDGDAVTYDFYLTETLPMGEPLARNLTEARYASLVNLEKGRKYYWQIVARDSGGHVIESSVFSFFTVSDVDLEAPKLVSVTPADNSSAAVDAEVKVVFSEPVNQTLAVNAFNFTPAISGSWTWENDATAKFWPTKPWPPGSYHRFVIADNQIKDTAGNTMATGG
ncbi:MAG: Ig-like domain-containing protein, partial [Candidatus Riflebacteria bacterium]